MNYGAWLETVEGVSCLGHMTQHGVPEGLALRILKAAYTSGALSGRCEGMSEALETAVRASVAKQQSSEGKENGDR